MYKTIIRPVLFLLDPEKVHHLVVFALKCAYRLPGMRGMLKFVFQDHSPLLMTSVAGLEFPGKVGLAAGFDKNADFFKEFSLFGFAFIEIGTVTPLPQAGNPKPRLFRLPKDKALINRMGFNNKGADYARKNLQKRDKTLIIGGNIGKNTTTPNERAPDDYLSCFNKLYDDVDYLVINVSCPNIAGLEKLQDQDSLRKILDRIMEQRAAKAVRKPVFLKISPDLSLTHLDEIISLYHEIGLDGIIATNTTTKRDGLISEDSRIKKIGKGGLSGHPLRNKTLEVISYICKQSGNSIPVIGVGGILTPANALEMIRAGASLVQVYTGFIYDGPFIVKRINKELKKHLAYKTL
jgi:dihydroorotate dehydrogenase